MNTEPLVSKIKEMVPRLVAHQQALGLKNRQFGARYRQYLGSEKTWIKLQDGTFAGHVNLERMLAKLTEFTGKLDGAAAFDREAFIGSMPFVTRMNAEYDRLLGSQRDRRCLICLAPEGVGKSWWSSAKLEEKEGPLRVYLRLRHVWREKPYHLTRALALKIGAAAAKNPASQLDELINTGKGLGEWVLILDEGHLGGVAVFRLLKDLIDEIPGFRVVYLAFPTEFDNVRSSNSSAMAEARQLFRRSLRPIFDDYRNGITVHDVMAFLRARGFDGQKALRDASEHITAKLVRNQNLSTLDDALDEATEQADDQGVPISLPMVREQVDALTTTSMDRRAEEDRRARETDS